MIAVSMVGLVEGLTPQETPSPQSAVAKLAADLRAGLITQEQYEIALQGMAPRGMTIESDGQGGFRVVQGAGVGGEFVPPGGQNSPATTMPPGVDFTNATGASGAISGMLNTVTDAFGLGLAAPENEQAATAMRNLARRTMIELAKDVPGRPSNYLLQQFEALTTSPNSIWQGEGRTRERLNQTLQLIELAIRDNLAVANGAGTYSARDVADARRNLVGLSGLRDDYAAVIESFGRRESAPPRQNAPETTNQNDRPPPPGVDPADWQYMTPEEKALWE
jgi:hypothetical protein